MHPLTASGNRIIDTVTGDPVVLRGVNRSGFEYSTEAIPAAELDQMVLGWGAAIVRLPFNQEWALTDEQYLTALDLAIDGLAARGAYALLDLQWLDARYTRGFDKQGRRNLVPALPDEGSVEVWRRLAQRYRRNSAVLYDIFNEPHDPLPGDDPALPRRVTARVWAPWARRLVESIRSQHPEALVFVPGVNWAYDLSSYPIDGLDGVVYSTHVYRNKGRRWGRAFGRLSSRAPVFAGDRGAGPRTTSTGADSSPPTSPSTPSAGQPGAGATNRG